MARMTAAIWARKSGNGREMSFSCRPSAITPCTAENKARATTRRRVAMLIQSCITLTKRIRGNDEAGKLVSRLEDARTERLLMDVAKGQP